MTQALTLPAARLWRDFPRETLAVGLLALAASAAIAGSTHIAPASEGTEGVAESPAPPAPPPLLVRQLAPQDALSINQTIPVATGPNPAARPFAFKGSSAARAQALECLTSAIYYEAGQESTAGQQAVAQVVLNRVRHPAFPASVCGVVYQGSTRATGCQFTFTCDGSLARRPMAEAWNRARKVAEAALAGAVYAPVGYATHYHANYVVPYWASSLVKNGVVGAHLFYRWAGGWGRPGAFNHAYAGAEPNSAVLRSAALAAEAAQPARTELAVAEAVAEIPGAEVKQSGGRQISVRFNLAAREAVEKAIRERPAAAAGSDNLRWSLSSASVSADQKPLGKAEPKAATAAAASSAVTAAPVQP